MSAGVYSAFSGAVANLARLEIIANNVANANTAGFRRDQTVFDTQLGAALPFAAASDTAVDLTPGTQRLSGNTLHVALDGPGFFVIEGPDGEPRLTRRGDFQLSPSGELRLPNGARVLGAGGPLVAPPDAQLSFRSDGTLVGPGGALGRLRVVEVERPELLEKTGESALRAPAEAGLRDRQGPALAVGFVEESNVNLAAELVALIEAQRAFEASVRSMQIHDEMADQLLAAANG
jgi:flagellar basal body rod protein FlgG